jgi:hypothetical protein
MSKLRTNIFPKATISNYFWSSVARLVIVNYFDISHKKFSAQTHLVLNQK